ncbi:MAG: tetratricopeptide repeat protein [Sphingomonadaceae bacterium]|nr:tetratricopeptide repeat protein [Sphingomonadaceae bacterium]
MASTPPTQEAFLREVDEELRRDELQSLWQRYGRLGIAIIVLLLAAWGGWLYWQAERNKASGLEGEQLSQALDDLQAANPDAALAKLGPLTRSKNVGYRASAKMAEAGVALGKDDFSGAAKIYGEVASDTSVPQPWRDLALIRQTAAEFDSIKPELVVTRLRPLAAKGNPWFGSAGEMVAAAYLKMGKAELAGKMFADIGKDENVPETIRSRAVQMAGSLGVDSAPLPTKEVTK